MIATANISKTLQPSYHRNQQYSIVALTNAAGTLVERYTYSAYGTLGIYAADGTVRTTSSYNNRYTYTGREWDAELKLYHFRARWYAPATGDFISRDPLGYVDGMSLYRGYFGASHVDPSGSSDCRCRCRSKNRLTGPNANSISNCLLHQGTIDVLASQDVANSHCDSFVKTNTYKMTTRRVKAKC